MTNQINTTKKVLVAVAVLAASAGVGAGIVIDNGPDPIIIDNTERIIINRTPMTTDEKNAFISAVNSEIKENGDIVLKNIDEDYTVIDALRAKVKK